ncbi:DDE-type integrase/transposase/recombinase [Amycolatopsis halotolerans]|uniref:DDE-type integrase/transposase/recombinase n=1 Tax=Amycolatopsis halotolerans TaxID=330083 RepID=A0ABV7QEF8_9PSEU
MTAENLLDRQFGADAPNTKWVTDVTEFRIGDRKLYLSPIIDLFDRSVVAWACGPSPSLDLTTTSLRGAIAALPPVPRRWSTPTRASGTGTAPGAP